MAAFDAWPVLILVPACLRLVWAEEVEKWLCGLLQPRHIHIIHSSDDMLPNTDDLGEMKVCIVSYTMTRLLFENLKRPWKVAIVDESHNLRNVRNASNASNASKTTSRTTKAVLELLRPVPRLLLLSGTPSPSSYLDVFTQANLLCPGLLGSYGTFAADYDEPSLSNAGYLEPGVCCRRPWQLNLLLTETLMVRRRKSEVLEELPAKRRRLLRLPLSNSSWKDLSEEEQKATTNAERVALLKLQAAGSWLREKLAEVLLSKEEGKGKGFGTKAKGKAVVFGHHLRVLDKVCHIAHGFHIIRIDSWAGRGCCLACH